MLVNRFERVRARTVESCASLSPEDAQLQSMPDASPAKWHLAHTTWFFEAFVLAPLGIAPERAEYAALFNSYYEAIGPRVERARRGQLSRPSLAEVHAYRAAIDRRVRGALAEGRADEALVELGLQHEEQHQELILTDIKHALGTQPTRPRYREDAPHVPAIAAPLAYRAYPGGVVAIGAPSGGFAFDNERPRHREFIEPFELASRPATNAEVLAFIADGGYRRPELWLADGWARAQQAGWTAPLYWNADGTLYDLGGVRAIVPAEPAGHLSYYEADALARWAGARLPTEVEWEHAAPPNAGHVWEWTQSAYAPYPGFHPLPGALGEYNGKFMSGQMVLRGGSRFTPPDHARPTYRNFFPPDARWQLAGARFARSR